MTQPSRSRKPLRLEYAGSAGSVEELPRLDMPEFAIVGRSNSGKSSLLNRLGGSKSLARVSRTPGRTQRLHFFVDPRERLVIVDLPGYGFAKAPRPERRAWEDLIRHYLANRESLIGLLLIADIRRDPDVEEEAVEAFVADAGLPIVRLANKADKLGRGQRGARLRALERTGRTWHAISARTGEGVPDLIEALAARASE